MYKNLVYLFLIAATISVYFLFFKGKDYNSYLDSKNLKQYKKTEFWTSMKNSKAYQNVIERVDIGWSSLFYDLYLSKVCILQHLLQLWLWLFTVRPIVILFLTIATIHIILEMPIERTRGLFKGNYGTKSAIATYPLNKKKRKPKKESLKKKRLNSLNAFVRKYNRSFTKAFIELNTKFDKLSKTLKNYCKFNQEQITFLERRVSNFYLHKI
ncbi:uncharacterized protein LOC111624220 [Centruroides sculpturatus]|uniref:uncharacterized protein LOC111624220 n=1 Tax=Centruroides sculpturatus TaxID=218467 RepID=UPI000C6EE84D|nr:uncharacterized protein LOC111624220 [Centruroides sculpturatus]